ncbi:hypothetical protein HK101_010203 [Irineochytrium annulatum]|nr:hypothetical protein HK101_010203 [Irineochytrium annulatum]
MAALAPIKTFGGLCLDSTLGVASYLLANPCDAASPSQLFTILPTGNGTNFRVQTNSPPNLFMAVWGGASSAEAVVGIYYDTHGTEQIFHQLPGSNSWTPTYTDSFCLDVYGGIPTPGSKLNLWPCTGMPNQIFQHTSVTELVADWNPITTTNNLCLDSANGYYKGAIVTTCANTWTQQFRILPTDDGVNFRVQSLADQSLYLDVFGSATGNGYTVGFYSLSGEAGQLWHYKSGTHNIVPSYTDQYCLDANGNSPAVGASTTLWQCGNGQPNQMWSNPFADVADYNIAKSSDARVGSAQGVVDCPSQGTGKNLGLLARACNSMSNCLGFNSNGFLKCSGPRNILPALTPDSCDFYSKKSAKFGNPDFTPPPQWASIIRAYAPVYRVHPSESYFPVDPLDWFSQVTLWQRNAPGSGDGSQVSANDHNLRSNLMSLSHHASSAEDQFNYEYLTPMMPDGSNVYGHMGGAAGWSDCNQLPILCGSPNAKNNINNIPVYAIAVDKPEVNAVDVFYWTWWGYNQGNYIGASTIADVVCGSSWNPANWPYLEHVVIRFNRNTGKPSQLWMDHHGNDDQYSRRTWNADGTPNGFQTKGVKPVVYVAQGSHEGYPQVGSFLTFASTNGLLRDFLSMTADGVLDHTADGGVEWDAEANLQVRWGVTEPRTPPAISYVRNGDGDVMHWFMREDGTIKQEDAWMCYGGRVGILEASGNSLYYSAMNPVIRVDAPEIIFSILILFL